MSTDQTPCCPPFDPSAWDDRQVTWHGKRFVRDRVRSFLHIPLNFGAVMKRSMARIEQAGATTEDMIVLADENSLWGADVYIAVSKDVPDADNAQLTGEFLSKVFEGPFRNIKQWIAQMSEHVQQRDKQIRKLYFYYTTCPKCAKKYGKNYVVLLAQV